MVESDDSPGFLAENRYSVAQLLLGTGVVLWGALRAGPVVWVAGVILGSGGLAKPVARRFDVSKRTFTVLNIGPLFLLGCYIGVLAAAAGSWGFAIIAVTVVGMAVGALLPKRRALAHHGIAVVGFGVGTLYYAIAGDLIVAVLALFFVGLNGRSLLQRRDGTAENSS